MPKVPLSALEKALKLLSNRALSRKELTEKLFRAGFPAGEVEDAVSECCRRRFVDDSMLAEDYTSLLRSRNTGSRVIRQKLQRRGLKAELNDDGTLPEEDSGQQEREAAMRALDYKWRLLSRESDPRKKREKAFRFLAGRGFPPGLIFELLDNMPESEDC
ncbi:MAG: regulatory protein RecX [Lentisphaeria bacterium]|nr:regulatory protein RecX [Lentisphaeria bacterium]